MDVQDGVLTTGWQMGTEVNQEPMALTQVGIVGQRGTQAGLPTVGYRAQIRRAGCKELPCEHAAGL